MIILETLWEIILCIVAAFFVLWILYNICEFIDWVECKRFEKYMNEYLKQKQESLERYAYELHLQYMMREWNW